MIHRRLQRVASSFGVAIVVALSMWMSAPTAVLVAQDQTQASGFLRPCKSAPQDEFTNRLVDNGRCRRQDRLRQTLS